MSNNLVAAIEKLAKWRLVLAGWHLGTKAKTEAGVQAMRDLRETVLILRAEGNAIVQLLIKKGVCTEDEWCRQLEVECGHLERAYERSFPGIRASEIGMVFYDAAMAAKTMKEKGFPP